MTKEKREVQRRLREEGKIGRKESESRLQEDRNTRK